MELVPASSAPMNVPAVTELVPAVTSAKDVSPVTIASPERSNVVPEMAALDVNPAMVAPPVSVRLEAMRGLVPDEMAPTKLPAVIELVPAVISAVDVNPAMVAPPVRFRVVPEI